MMNKVNTFLHDVKSEMRKTSWPKYEELKKYTITVISVVVIMALFFTAVDLTISGFMREFIFN